MRAKTGKPGLVEFEADIRASLAFHSIPPPPRKVGELAKWVFDDPARCPGFRLAYEWHQQWKKNARQPFDWNNIFDRAHVLALPYVDAATMDRNAAAHCRSAVKRLKKINRAINYDRRVFTRLKELPEAKF